MIIETKNDDKVFLSQEFKRIMLTENLYLVKISTPPDNFLFLDIPFEEHYENPPYFLVKGDFINTYDDDFDDWDSMNYHKLDIDKFYQTINKEKKLRSNLLIVKTGESTDYVREILTNKKIPVAYYNQNKNSHYNFFDENKRIRSSYIRAFEIENSYNFKTKYCGSRISNFNEFNLLSSFSLDDIKKVLLEYKNTHSNIDKFRTKILSIFEKNENVINGIIKEYERKKEINEIKKHNKLIRIYVNDTKKIVNRKK